MQNEIRITCPRCENVFALDETLAGPLVQKVRTELQAQVDAERRKAQDAEAALLAKEAELNSRVAKAVTAKRGDLEKELRDQINAETAADLKARDERAKELEDKLKESRQAQLHAVKAKQVAEEKAASIDLEIVKQVDEQTAAIREQATKDAAQAEKAKLAEKDQVIERLKVQAEELKRKAEQGSQKNQGEAAETELEDSLTQAFPWDGIEPVKSGVRGADVLQRVSPAQGIVCGAILWERKRAHVWGGTWAAKAKRDASEAKAEVVVIVSEVPPKEVEDFGPYNGVWVAKPAFAIPLAHALRQGVIEAATARKAVEGKQTKQGMLYDYMSGPEFVTRLRGIAEPFVQMQTDLDSEIRTTTQRWGKRKKLIDMVLNAAYGLRGDIEAVTGADLPELEQVELKALISSGSEQEEVQS